MTFWKGKTVGDKSDQWLQGEGDWGRGLVTAKGHEETFWGNGNILYVDSVGDGYVTVFVKTQKFTPEMDVFCPM